MHKAHKKKKCRNWLQKSSSPQSSTTSESEDLSDESRNRTYTIKHSEEMGRYVVASKDLKPGTLLIRELPLVLGPCTGAPVCINCHIPLTQPDLQPQPCPRCQWPICGPACGGQGHSEEECEALAATGSTCAGIGYIAIAPLRCLLLRDADPEKWEAVMRMQGHEQQRKKWKQRWEEEEKEVVNRIKKEWKMDFSEQEIRDVCGILQVNAFEVGRRGISIRAIYPRAYLLAHSCIPNTTHTDEDITFRLSLRTSTNIKKGELITLTYAYTLQSTTCRRDHLYQGKFFWCHCSRCKDPTEMGTNAGTLRCPKCHEATVVPKEPLNEETIWQCGNKKCVGYEVAGNSVKLLMDKIADEVETLDCSDVSGFESFLHRYRNVLHPTHYQCLGVKHSLSQLYGKVDGYLIHKLPERLLNRKVEICQELMKVFDVLEPGYSRLRGMTLYELHAPLMILATRDFEAKLISKDELRKRLQEVVFCLQESEIILSLEPDNSAENIMACAAKEALRKIKDWEKILGKIV